MKIFGYKLEHIVSPERWKMVMVSIYRLKFKPWLMNKAKPWVFKKLVAWGFEDPPAPETPKEDYINDIDRAAQIMFRYITCYDPCVRTGKCIECNCLMPDSIIAPNNQCSRGKWPKMRKGFLKEFEKSGARFAIIPPKIDF